MNLVVFVWQGHHFGVEASRVAAMGQIGQLPAGTWKQIDLTSLCSASVPPAPVQHEGSYLQFRDLPDTTLLLLEHRARLLEIDAMQIWPLPVMLEHARQHPCIKALAWHEDRPILLLEPALLPIL